MLFDKFYMHPSVATARKGLFSYLVKKNYQLRPNFQIIFDNGLEDTIDMLAFKDNEKYAIILGKKSIRKRYKTMFEKFTGEDYTKIVLLCGARIEDDHIMKDGIHYINVKGTAAWARD